MPLIVDQLQLWTIGFKWAGLDPNRIWLKIPTIAKDNFSSLLEAILNLHLDCISLMPEKYEGNDSDIARHYIRYWINDVHDAVHGNRFSRKLLKHAVIERGAFKDWCERRTIPLPEFWFPPGWTDYRWPEQDFDTIPERPAGVDEIAISTLLSSTRPDERESPGAVLPSIESVDESRLKPAPLAKIVCKQIAKVIWKDEPETTIAAMTKHDLILKYGGGQHYTEEVVRRWVKEVAPAEVSAKRGRPRKRNPTEDS